MLGNSGLCEASLCQFSEGVVTTTAHGHSYAAGKRRLVRQLIAQEMSRSVLSQTRKSRIIKRATERSLALKLQEQMELVHQKRVTEAAAYTVLLTEL